MREFWNIILILSGVRIRKDGEKDERYNAPRRTLWFFILVLIVIVFLYNGAQNAFSSVSEWWSGVFDSKPTVIAWVISLGLWSILIVPAFVILMLFQLILILHIWRKRRRR